MTISLPIAPPVNQTPTVTTDVSDTTVDPITGTVSGLVRASDPEGDRLVFVVANAPDSSLGSFTLDSTSGRWTFTPTLELRDLAAQSPGDDSFGVTVLVGDGASVGSVVIDVPIAAALGPNRAPVFVDGPGSTTVDPRSGAMSGILTATDADGNPLTFTIVSGPQVAAGTVKIDSATGHWTLTPGGDTLMSAYFSGQPTTLTFTASVSDGALSSSRTVTVPVTLSRNELVTMLERDGSRPVALAVAGDGRLYVVDEGANTLTIIDRVAGTSHTVATGRAPTDVAVSSDGLVYVSNGQDNTVFVYNADGYLYRQLNVGAGPTGITVAPDGRAYVTTRTGLGVVIIDTGAYSVSSFAVAVPGADQVAVAADGTVFVLENGSSSVTVVDPTTESVRSVSGSWSAGSMTVSADGVVFLTDPGQGVVIRLTPDGAGGFIEHLIDVPGAPGAVTIGADGLIRLADVSTGSIFMMNSQGDVLSKFVVDSTPSRVVVDAAGTAYVIGLDTADITIIDEGGTVSTLDAAVAVNNITVGQAGELIVVNKYTGSVSVVSAATDLSAGYSIDKAVLSDATQTKPQVAYGADGAVYVARAGYFDITVYRLVDGTYQSGNVGSFLSSAETMMVSEDGRVYVFWTGSHRSQGLAQMDFASRGNIPIPIPYQISTVGLGIDGTLLVADASAGDLVFVDPDSFAEIRRVHLWAPSHYSAITMDVGTDGSIYLIPTSDGQKKLSVLNSTGDLMREVTLPWNSGVIEVGSDGKVYLANELGEIFVLSSDFESITVVPTGVTPQAIVEGPNGLIFVSTGQGALVIDPLTYAIDSESRVGTILDMYSRPGGPIYLIEYQSYYNASSFTVDIIGDPLPDVPDYPDPEPGDDPSQPIQFEQSPATFEALYDRLWSKPGNDDGIHTEIVRDWDGARRVVVYLGGTSDFWGLDHQTWVSNAPTYVGLLKPHQLEMIDAAIAECGDDCSEMMLVGYSQGGMDALNLADHYSELATTVITFGSPISQPAQWNDRVVHIRDTRDPIPALSNALASWVADWNGQVFKGSTRNGWGMGLHGDKKTYLTLGRELDKSTDSKYSHIKNALARFQGDIMPEPVVTEF
ncbi:VCBS domain-containing protein [Rhodococcus sp. NPDC079359]|uniref:VCBS domain-containing protein n=1 Tax=Rhodococcus sp. NPDC079359 TaxID=3154961 RepID=UPI00344EB521